jgi:hypothetical protein
VLRPSGSAPTAVHSHVICLCPVTSRVAVGAAEAAVRAADTTHKRTLHDHRPVLPYLRSEVRCSVQTEYVVVRARKRIRSGMAVPFAVGQAGLRALAIGTARHRSLFQLSRRKAPSSTKWGRRR